MSSYRCYFLDLGARIAGEMTIRSEDLADAIEQAGVMLDQRPHFCGFEPWEGDTLAYSSPLTLLP
jgi:hypothetical protein